MWVRLWDWMIADGEVPVPREGSVLAGVGVRWRGEVALARPDTPEGVEQTGTGRGDHTVYRVTGLATEARDFDMDFDGGERKHAGADFVLTLGNVRFQVQFKGWARDVVEGSRVSVTGRAEIIGAYEWEAFGLTDVRADWTVTRISDADDEGVMLEVAAVSGFGQDVYDTALVDPMYARLHQLAALALVERPSALSQKWLAPNRPSRPHWPNCRRSWKRSSRSTTTTDHTDHSPTAPPRQPRTHTAQGQPER